jgi:predicted Zn-dependent protease
VMARAEIQLSLGHPAEALATLAPVLAGIARPVRPGGGLHVGRSLIVASRAALAAQRLDDAGQFAADAVEITRLVARRPEFSADVGEAYLALAEACLARGDQAGAHEAAGHAVESLTNGLDASHPLTRQAAPLAHGPEA